MKKYIAIITIIIAMLFSLNSYALRRSSLPEIGQIGKLFSEIEEEMKVHFAAMDTNGDGKISVEEFDRYYANRMKEADTNNDGRLDREEMLQIQE